MPVPKCSAWQSSRLDLITVFDDKATMRFINGDWHNMAASILVAWYSNAFSNTAQLSLCD